MCVCFPFNITNLQRTLKKKIIIEISFFFFFDELVFISKQQVSHFALLYINSRKPEHASKSKLNKKRYKTTKENQNAIPVYGDESPNYSKCHHRNLALGFWYNRAMRILESGSLLAWNSSRKDILGILSGGTDNTAGLILRTLTSCPWQHFRPNPLHRLS